MRTVETFITAEFKADCLGILDRLAAQEFTSVVITKHGKPVAMLTALATPYDAIRQLHGFMRGSVVIPEGFDLTEPIAMEQNRN